MSAMPRKRQLAVKASSVAMGQNLAHAVQQNRALFDNRVGVAEQHEREADPNALAVVASCTGRLLEPRVVTTEVAGPNARKNILDWEQKNAAANRATLDPLRRKRP